MILCGSGLVRQRQSLVMKVVYLRQSVILDMWKRE